MNGAASAYKLFTKWYFRIRKVLSMTKQHIRNQDNAWFVKISARPNFNRVCDRMNIRLRTLSRELLISAAILNRRHLVCPFCNYSLEASLQARQSSLLPS
jgi:hypothetical protein